MYQQSNSETSKNDHTKVLIVGAGGLGSAAAHALAGAGLESITLVDPDVVELSNLQRQILFSQDDIGSKKVTASAAALKREFPDVDVVCLPYSFDVDNAEELISAHDYVIDAVDDPAIKFLINRVAVKLGIPFCYGGIIGARGQMMGVEPGVSSCLACVFPDQRADEEANCSQMGILAPVAGVIGSLQASAAAAALGLGAGPEPGRMIIFNLEGERWQSVSFKNAHDCPCCAQAFIHDDRRVETCHSY